MTRYASPMVLIFSTPVRSQIASNPEKSWFISSISAAGARRDRDLREPDDIGEQHADLVVAIRDQQLARLQAVDDPLRQHVEQQPLRSRALGLELGEQARGERRVRILELLEPPDVGLEALEAAGEPEVLLRQLVRRARGGWLGRQAGSTASAGADPSRTETIVALWNRVPSAEAIGAISPMQ